MHNSPVLKKSLPELIGLQPWNRKGDDIFRTDVVDALFCLKSGRCGLRKNLGIQLPTHDNAQSTKNNETAKTTKRITGFIFIWSISYLGSPILAEKEFPASNRATPSVQVILPGPIVTWLSVICKPSLNNKAIYGALKHYCSMKGCGATLFFATSQVFAQNS